jgi:hypothetical protein
VRNKIFFFKKGIRKTRQAALSGSRDGESMETSSSEGYSGNGWVK